MDAVADFLRSRASRALVSTPSKVFKPSAAQIKGRYYEKYRGTGEEEEPGTSHTEEMPGSSASHAACAARE